MRNLCANRQELKIIEPICVHRVCVCSVYMCVIQFCCIHFVIFDLNITLKLPRLKQAIRVFAGQSLSFVCLGTSGRDS